MILVICFLFRSPRFRGGCVALQICKNNIHAHHISKHSKIVKTNAFTSLVPRPIRAIRTTSKTRQAWQVTSSPRTTGKEAALLLEVKARKHGQEVPCKVSSKCAATWSVNSSNINLVPRVLSNSSMPILFLSTQYHYISVFKPFLHLDKM